MEDDLFVKIVQHPVLLFAELTGSEPFDYQICFLNCFASRICFRSGRQIGKTMSSAIKAIHHTLIKPYQQAVILAPTQRQSSLMFRKIRSYLQHPEIKKLIVKETQTMIVFNNGSEIICVPGNNPDTIRGYSPTLLIIDEAAFLKDDVYTAVEPSLAATQGQLILISTPFGKRGRFYNAFNEEIFIKFHIPSKMNPFITAEFLEREKLTKTEIEYLQEYEGEFIEEADTYFSRELILSCINEIEEIKSPRDHKIYFLGVDCARFGLDETVYIIIEVDTNNNVQVIFIESTHKMPITDIIGRVQHLHKLWNFKNIFIDASGLGGGAVDVLKEKGIPLRNMNGERDGITFTLSNKAEMYKNTKMLMEQKRLKFPNRDKLVNQLADLQYQYTSTGLIQIHHPNTSNAHDDYPDALVLACLGVREKRGSKGYISI